MKKMFLKIFGGALMLTLVITSCKKTTDVALPPIGGFNNAGEVGKTDLVAYIPLDCSGEESISKKSPEATTGVSFTSGKKGQCASLTKGYLAYPAIAALSANTASYSVSCWFTAYNNKTDNGGSATMLVSLTRPNEWAGNFNFLSETGWRASGNDTLILKGLLVSREGTPAVDSWQDSRNEPSKGGDQAIKLASTTTKENWVHGVITYDATNSNFLIYANGKKVSNPEWEVRSFNSNPLGDLVFNPGATRLVLGAFGTNIPGNGTIESWQVPMTGKMDEVRIWKKALSAQEIDALYQLESAGR